MSHREKWEAIRAKLSAMEGLESGPLLVTISCTEELADALEACHWVAPIEVATRRSLGADHDDGITLTWRRSDNTFHDITVWDERDT